MTAEIHTAAPEALALADALFALQNARRCFVELSLDAQCGHHRPGDTEAAKARLSQFEAEYHQAAQAYADAVVAVVKKVPQPKPYDGIPDGYVIHGKDERLIPGGVTMLVEKARNEPWEEQALQRIQDELGPKIQPPVIPDAEIHPILTQ